jgi:uncharacterized membrane protein YdjX (TVP38/TMEM64 family)
MAETLAPAPAAAATEKKPFPVLKVVIAVLVLAALIALFRFLPVKEWIEQFKAYVRGQGALGYVLFGLVYVAASLIPGGPAALLTLAAGAIYGVARGTALVSVSSVTAATIAFLLARTVFQQKVERMTAGNAKFQSLNRAIAKQGGKIVALVRLSPVFPFTFINYAFGLTPVKTLTYILASWIAMLPGTLAYVYFGAAVGDVAGNADPKQKAIKIGLAAAAIVATIVIARIAAKAIKNAGVDEGTKKTEAA